MYEGQDTQISHIYTITMITKNKIKLQIDNQSWATLLQIIFKNCKKRVIYLLLHSKMCICTIITFLDQKNLVIGVGTVLERQKSKTLKGI